MPTFPLTARKGFDDAATKRARIGEAEDGSRIVTILQNTKRVLDVTFTRRTQANVEAVETFYDDNHPGTSFTYTDTSVVPSESLTMVFADDAEIEVIPDNHISYTIKTTFREL